MIVRKCFTWYQLYDLVLECREAGLRDIRIVLNGKILPWQVVVWDEPTKAFPLWVRDLEGKEFWAVGCDLGYDSPNPAVDRAHLLNALDEVLRAVERHEAATKSQPYRKPGRAYQRRSAVPVL